MRIDAQPKPPVCLWCCHDIGAELRDMFRRCFGGAPRFECADRKACDRRIDQKIRDREHEPG